MASVCACRLVYVCVCVCVRAISHCCKYVSDCDLRCYNDIHRYTDSYTQHTGYCITIIPLSILLFSSLLSFFFSLNFKSNFRLYANGKRIFFLSIYVVHICSAICHVTCAAQIEHSLCTMVEIVWFV